ncbi:MAG: rRNA maturation RNase YbeY [Patescibacteria group bacterium]
MIVLENFSHYKVKKTELLKTIKSVLKHLEVWPSWWLEVYLVDYSQMEELHRQLLKKSGPTTVISLGLPDNFFLAGLSGGGEVYLCPEEIKKSGLSLEYFLIHGILHLAGFNHQTQKQEKLMLAKEAEICAKIGL